MESGEKAVKTGAGQCFIRAPQFTSSRQEMKTEREREERDTETETETETERDTSFKDWAEHLLCTGLCTSPASPIHTMKPVPHPTPPPGDGIWRLGLW